MFLLGALVTVAREHPALFWGGTALVLLLVVLWLYRRNTAKVAEAKRLAEEDAARQAEEAARQAQREADRAAREAEDAARRARRKADLTTRFGAEVAERVLRGEVWQGQTAEMLVEACGQPADTDERVMKKATRHVYKYKPLGGRRYALRVTLEDGVVVGWEDRR